MFPHQTDTRRVKKFFLFFFQMFNIFHQLTSGSMSFFNQISSDRGCYYHRATKITKALYQRQGRAMPGVLANSPFPTAGNFGRSKDPPGPNHPEKYEEIYDEIWRNMMKYDERWWKIGCYWEWIRIRLTSLAIPLEFRKALESEKNLQSNLDGPQL